MVLRIHQDGKTITIKERKVKWQQIHYTFTILVMDLGLGNQMKKWRWFCSGVLYTGSFHRSSKGGQVRSAQESEIRGCLGAYTRVSSVRASVLAETNSYVINKNFFLIKSKRVWMLPISHSGPYFQQRPWSTVPILFHVLDHQRFSLMFLFWVSLYILFSWSREFSQWVFSFSNHQVTSWPFSILCLISNPTPYCSNHCEQVWHTHGNISKPLGFWIQSSGERLRAGDLFLKYNSSLLVNIIIKKKSLTFLHWWRENEMKDNTELAK